VGEGPGPRSVVVGGRDPSSGERLTEEFFRAEERKHGEGDFPLVVPVIGLSRHGREKGARGGVEGGPCGGVEEVDLASLALRRAFFDEIVLECENHVFAPDGISQVGTGVFDVEEFGQESRHGRCGLHEHLGHLLGGHADPLRAAVAGEGSPGGFADERGSEGIEARREAWEGAQVAQVGVGEARDARRERGRRGAGAGVEGTVGQGGGEGKRMLDHCMRLLEYVSPERVGEFSEGGGLYTLRGGWARGLAVNKAPCS